jgi:carotenoid cleavage dioxygenase-like enzyme
LARWLKLQKFPKNYSFHHRTCEFHQSTATILCLGSEFEFVHAHEEEMEASELFGEHQLAMTNNFNVFLDLNYKYFIL